MQLGFLCSVKDEGWESRHLGFYLDFIQYSASLATNINLSWFHFSSPDSDYHIDSNYLL